MNIEIIDETGRPRIIRGVTRIVARDQRTNTVALAAIEHSPGVIIAETADNPVFNQFLKQMGILDTVIVDNLSQDMMHPRIS